MHVLVKIYKNEQKKVSHMLSSKLLGKQLESLGLWEVLTPKIQAFMVLKWPIWVIMLEFQMGPWFMSPESVKNIACVGHKVNTIEKEKKVTLWPTQNCLKKH